MFMRASRAARASLLFARCIQHQRVDLRRIKAKCHCCALLGDLLREHAGSALVDQSLHAVAHARAYLHAHAAEKITLADLTQVAGMTPTRVAAETGFFDQSYFTECFKHAIGVRPAQYALACL